MAIFSKRKKDEYWFVPGDTGEIQDKNSTATESKNTIKEKKTVKKSNPKSTATKKADTKKVQIEAKKEQKSDTKSKVQVKKPTAKTTNTVAKTTKSATKATAPKAANTSTKAATATPKNSIKAKTASATKQKNNSSIVTLTAANEIPRSIYYDEEEAERISKEFTSEKLEFKGFGGAFEIKKSKDDRYVFNLYAANHLIIATSQVYSSAQSAIVGINSVIANAERAGVEDQTLKKVTPVAFPKWEIYIDRGGQYRFRLSASNGSCICHSQGYTGKSACKNGIESIIRTVKSAKIDKSYLK